MQRTFISVPFSQNHKAEALGALWDPNHRSMYVPEGLDVALFKAWKPRVIRVVVRAAAPVALPAAPEEFTTTTASAVPALPTADKSAQGVTASLFEEPAVAPKPAAPVATPAAAVVLQAPIAAIAPVPAEESPVTPVSEVRASEPQAKTGVSLSALLSGVANAVAAAYRTGVWTMVEVVGVTNRKGHVYLELSERDSSGAVTAKASGNIWANNAKRIIPEFERATGATLASGIKLLVRARPIYKPQFGFSLEIDAIDPGYTLGDLEAKKREIRSRLQAAGIFGAQKALPTPWDYNRILVIAPDGAAGLGDFQSESNRLERHRLCEFVYVHSRFQGDGAAFEIVKALHAAVEDWYREREHKPDAVVIIRGGGSVNDLAWLNDHELAQAICKLPIPVLTGIGHERDSTLIDEVAHARFDTPSKVIAGVEAVIVRRSKEVAQFWSDILKSAQLTTQCVKSTAQKMEAEVVSGAERQVALAKVKASETCEAAMSGATVSITNARTKSKAHLDFVLERAVSHTLRVRVQVDAAFGVMSQGARAVIHDAKGRTKGLIREITGQGPQKTLSRGFSVVRDASGKVVTDAAHLHDGQSVAIQLLNGSATTRIEKVNP